MAEGARLESVFRVKPNEGSNPSLSAKFEEPALRRFFCARNKYTHYMSCGDYFFMHRLHCYKRCPCTLFP